MGYNTTLVVLNDFLSDIRDDPEFGRKVYHACLNSEEVDIGPGVKIAGVNHATNFNLYAVGGNTSIHIGSVSGKDIDFNSSKVGMQMLEQMHSLQAEVGFVTPREAIPGGIFIYEDKHR